IEGKISNLGEQTLYAVFESENGKLVDTVTCEKPGQFLIDQTQEGFHSVTLFFENKQQWLTAYLEPNEKVTITGDILYPTLIQVKGGRINDKLSAMRKEIAPLLKEQADLINLLNKNMLNKKESSSAVTDEMDISSRLSNVNHQISEQAHNYVQANPEELASVVLIEHYFANTDDTRRMDELLAVLSPKLKDNYLVKNLKEYSAKAKRTALGAEAPGFTVTNVYGSSISLDSFPQKYVLLTFTAPWCDMCQTENLYLDDIVAKFPKDKLDILVISLDDNQKEVRSLLLKDSIRWNLVTDSAGQAAMMLNLYNVSALPRCFLIDEEGKILLKTENGMEIKKALETLMDKD
ncbi:MAG: TlpA disulfide reductase family protein, partial [Tannerellaceae bacterium]